MLAFLELQFPRLLLAQLLDLLDRLLEQDGHRVYSEVQYQVGNDVQGIARQVELYQNCVRSPHVAQAIGQKGRYDVQVGNGPMAELASIRPFLQRVRYYGAPDVLREIPYYCQNNVLKVRLLAQARQKETGSYFKLRLPSVLDLYVQFLAEVRLPQLPQV